MRAFRIGALRLTRRHWAGLLLAAPAAAQVTSPAIPPAGAPAPASPSASPDEKLRKAYDDIREVSNRLAAMEVPMNVEPAFSFRA